ncbi:MAG TPA: hypothetical protein VFO50_03990 [Candidatus Limnocylindrales bacterium]|nr:hypothetical protein [Candidatus Limnocylindrales bacterium]
MSDPTASTRAAAPDPAAHAAAGAVGSGLSLVRGRPVVSGPVEVAFAIRPGDRPLVAIGQAVDRGTPLADLVRDARTAVTTGPADPAVAVPGGFWSAPAARVGTAETAERGELLFRSGGRWRIGTGEHPEPLEAPFGGIVADVRPGIAIRLRAPARAIAGREVLAGPSSGRLEIIAARDGEVRASEIDVGGAGAVLVVGAHIDAEAITRARAVGVRGIVVAALGVKERRDVLASERRGQAAVHGLPPFAILVLDGAGRQSIASPVMAALERVAGRIVAIVGDPPCLVIDDPDVELPPPEPDLVRVVAGPLAGAEGLWAGLAGPHRFPGGVLLEAGWVRFAGRPPIAIPIGELERFT